MLSFVVFLRSAATIPQSPFAVSWGQRERLRYDFEVIRLWELPPEQVLATDHYRLWPLAALMGRPSVRSAVNIAERIANAPLERHERVELTGLLVGLASRGLPKAQLGAALRRTHMPRDLIDESALAELMYEIFPEKFDARGVAKGEAKGLREAVLTVLESRFGPQDESVRAAIEGLDTDTLKALVPAAATAPLTEVRARLGLASGA